MNIKRSATVLISFILIVSQQVLGQETMLNDFSYLYLEKLVAVAKENYPKVKALDNRVNIAKNNLGSEKLGWLEPFSFSYYYSSNNNTIDLINPALLTGYQIGISVNPGAVLRRPFAVKNAREEIEIAELEEQEYELQLEAEVKRRYLQYVQSLNNLRLQSKIVLDADGNYKDLKIKYEKGEITFQDYNNASQALNSAYQAKIAAEATVITSKVTLEEILVKKLEEIK